MTENKGSIFSSLNVFKSRYCILFFILVVFNIYFTAQWRRRSGRRNLGLLGRFRLENTHREYPHNHLPSRSEKSEFKYNPNQPFINTNKCCFFNIFLQKLKIKTFSLIIFGARQEKKFLKDDRHASHKDFLFIAVENKVSIF